jgi:hypothetical protein
VTAAGPPAPTDAAERADTARAYLVP